MGDFFLGIASKLYERGLSSKVKFVLEVIFIASITSLIFTTVYFRYSLLEPLDITAQYNFLINGHFFVPLSIFFILWVTTEYIAVIIFKLPVLAAIRFLSEKIYRFSVSNLSIFDNETEQKLMQVANTFVNVPKTNWMKKLLNLIKKKMSSEDRKEINRRIAVGQKRVEQEFIFVFRMLIAVIFYFASLDYFGRLLFSIVIIGIIIWMLLLAISYVFAELFPVLLNKIASTDFDLTEEVIP